MEKYEKSCMHHDKETDSCRFLICIVLGEKIAPDNEMLCSAYGNKSFQPYWDYNIYIYILLP